MLVIISPTKTFDFETSSHIKIMSDVYFKKEAKQLVGKLKSFSVASLKELMNISDELAQTNIYRYKKWSIIATKENSKQAILAYSGESFKALNAKEMLDDDFIFAQKHLRILSALYGVLKPLDLIQAYRLEMATKLKIKNFTNLYQFWGDKITEYLNSDMQGVSEIINLASNEYLKSINNKKIKANIITPVFKDFSRGKYKAVAMYAKNARGTMANYIIKNRITNIEKLKDFNINGYCFSQTESDKNTWVFLRKIKRLD